MINSRLGVCVAALVIAVAVACGGGDDPPTPTPDLPTATPVPAPTVAPPTPTVSPEPTATPAPTATPLPTAAPTPTPEPTATPSALGTSFFLDRLEPSDSEVFADSPDLEIVGRTRVDAVVTVNDDLAEPDADGVFSHTVALEIGVNLIEVVASVSEEEQDSFVVTAVYLP